MTFDVKEGERDGDGGDEVFNVEKNISFSRDGLAWRGIDAGTKT